MVVNGSFGRILMLNVLLCTMATPPPRPETRATCWKVWRGGVNSVMIASSPVFLSHVSVMANTSQSCSMKFSFIVSVLFLTDLALINATLGARFSQSLATVFSPLWAGLTELLLFCT